MNEEIKQFHEAITRFKRSSSENPGSSPQPTFYNNDPWEEYCPPADCSEEQLTKIENSKRKPRQRSKVLTLARQGPNRQSVDRRSRRKKRTKRNGRKTPQNGGVARNKTTRPRRPQRTRRQRNQNAGGLSLVSSSRLGPEPITAGEWHSAMNEIIGKAHRRGEAGTIHRFDIKTPLTLLKSRTKSKTVGDLEILTMTGSEYLNQVSTTVSGSTNATAAGDMLYTLPLHPVFLPGTRVSLQARQFRKFKFKWVVFEICPIASSMQSGTLIGWVNHDIAENISLTSDAQAKMRQAMAESAASEWNVYSYAHIPYEDDGQVDWYYTGVIQEPQLFCAGYLALMAGSTYSSVDAATGSVPIVSIIMHYKIDFIERILEPEANTSVNYLALDTNGAVSDVFPLYAANQEVLLKSAIITGVIPIDYTMVYIIGVYQNATVNGAQINVITPDGTRPFLKKGSEWYGAWLPSGVNQVFCFYADYQSALERADPNIFFSTSLTAGHTVHLYYNITGIVNLPQ